MVRKGTILHRFHNGAFGPIYFDKGLGGRLNSPSGSYGVLYAALNSNGAFAEAFLRTPGRRLLDPHVVAGKAYAQLEALADLKFIHLDGPSLAVMGATAEIVHSGGPPYPNPQAWSFALHGHPEKADGIAYSSRHDPHQICLAVFDRAAHAIGEFLREADLDQEWFWELADIYEMGQPPS
jgi:hypothetical protein